MRTVAHTVSDLPNETHAWELQQESALEGLLLASTIQAMLLEASRGARIEVSHDHEPGVFMAVDGVGERYRVQLWLVRQTIDRPLSLPPRHLLHIEVRGGVGGIRTLATRQLPRDDPSGIDALLTPAAGSRPAPPTTRPAARAR